MVEQVPEFAALSEKKKEISSVLRYNDRSSNNAGDQGRRHSRDWRIHWLDEDALEGAKKAIDAVDECFRDLENGEAFQRALKEFPSLEMEIEESRILSNADWNNVGQRKKQILNGLEFVSWQQWTNWDKSESAYTT